MLRNRILTAIIAAAVVLGVLFALPDTAFAILWGAVFLWAGWEWAILSDLKLVARLFFISCLLVSMVALWLWIPILQEIAYWLGDDSILQYSGWIDWFPVPALLCWLVMTTVIRRMDPDRLLGLRWPKWVKTSIGWLLLITAWLTITRLRSYYALDFTIYILLLIWTADIAAYFVGRKYGTHKLAEHISPGKTVQGMYGALLASALLGLLFGLYYEFPILRLADFILLSVVTVAVSVYGDLFVSLFKRWKGVKDSGSVLPGHGGILDRNDSLTAALPFYYIGVVLLYRTI